MPLPDTVDMVDRCCFRESKCVFEKMFASDSLNNTAMTVIGMED